MMKYQNSSILLGGSAAIASMLVMFPGDATAAWDCACLPGYINRNINRAEFEGAAGSYNAGIPSDGLYGLQTSTAPNLYFDYFATAANQTTYMQACKQAYNSSASTCATTTSRTSTGAGAQDVIVNVSGIYSTGNSVWDYYNLHVWGANLSFGDIFGAGLQAYMCW